MAEEVEKKYRLTVIQRERILAKLDALGARFGGADFEVNTLYRGGILTLKAAILRLRETETRAILTYKESLPDAESGVKRRLEHETEISDVAAFQAILTALQFSPALIYEKRRQTFDLGNVEIVVDELPFGYFLEIEGAEADILAMETTLEILDCAPEPLSYPALTSQNGVHKVGIVEARF